MKAPPEGVKELSTLLLVLFNVKYTKETVWDEAKKLMANPTLLF